MPLVNGPSKKHWLGYWLTPQGLKPWTKNICHLPHGLPLECHKTMHSCTHILKPLTDHSGLKKHAPIPWTPDLQTAFDKMLVLMATDALAAYLDHNK
ncbi:hypothetical protein ACHAW6_000168 [Cyclotella cf. meneghiniana]